MTDEEQVAWFTKWWGLDDMTRSTKAFCAEEALEKIEKALGILEERGTCADVEEVLDKIEDALKARREEKGTEQDNENTPHLTIPTLDGNVHVLPVLLISDWISGEQRIQDAHDSDMIIRSILAEWLHGLKEKPPANDEDVD